MPGESRVVIGVPAGWERAVDPEEGIALVMASRSRPASGFAPSMAVAVTALPPDWNRSAYLSGLRAELASDLERLDVEDEDAFDLNGVDVDYLRLSHRAGDHDLVTEIWVWLVDGFAWSVSGSVDRRDYAEYCEVFEGVAATFEPEESRLAG